MNLIAICLSVCVGMSIGLEAEVVQKKSDSSILKYISDLFTFEATEQPMKNYSYRRRCIWKICSHPLRNNHRKQKEKVLNEEMNMIRTILRNKFLKAY